MPHVTKALGIRCLREHYGAGYRHFCLCQYHQQGLNAHILLARLRYIMAGLEVVQHPQQTRRRQLWHNSVDDQQVVEALDTSLFVKSRLIKKIKF
jgi:hypothetical protein